MAEIEQWSGLSGEVESRLRNWLGLSGEVESRLRNWLGLSENVEDMLYRYLYLSMFVHSRDDLWSGLEGNVEGLVEQWVGQSAYVVMKVLRYVRMRSVVEGVGNLWCEDVMDVVGKNIRRYVRDVCNVEGYDYLYVVDSIDVEEFDNEWCGIGGVYQNERGVYVGSNFDVEELGLLYGRSYCNIEGYENGYVRNKSNVEEFKNSFCRTEFGIEGVGNSYCGLGMAVKPNVYVVPDFGEYENGIEVEIVCETMPDYVRYSFGKNEGIYSIGHKIKIISDKELSVEAGFGAYVVRRKGKYKINNVDGYVIYRDMDNIVYIDEEVLWKKE